MSSTPTIVGDAIEIVIVLIPILVLALVAGKLEHRGEKRARRKNEFVDTTPIHGGTGDPKLNNWYEQQDYTNRPMPFTVIRGGKDDGKNIA